MDNSDYRIKGKADESYDKALRTKKKSCLLILRIAVIIEWFIKSCTICIDSDGDLFGGEI